jgi:hypothetical protein
MLRVIGSGFGHQKLDGSVSNIPPAGDNHQYVDGSRYLFDAFRGRWGSMRFVRNLQGSDLEAVQYRYL